jgi:hypothetical protein
MKTGRIGTLIVGVVFGFGALVYVPSKDGIIIHDQGNAIDCERVDEFYEFVKYNSNICTYTQDKWPEGGCSYRWVVNGDWILENQEEGAKSIHTRFYNSFADAIMVVRTDNEDWNKRTAYTTRLLLIELNKIHDYDFVITHQLADPTRKSDPHEFIPWFEKMGVLWDSRPYPRRIESVLPEPSYQQWKQI